VTKATRFTVYLTIYLAIAFLKLFIGDVIVFVFV